MVSCVCVYGFFFYVWYKLFPIGKLFKSPPETTIHICAASRGRCGWQGMPGDSVCMASGSGFLSNDDKDVATIIVAAYKLPPNHCAWYVLYEAIPDWF